MSSDPSQLRHDTPSALHPGTRLGEYELLRLLGVGGFGIVYLAFDHALEREVAIKEYMPASLAGRTETMHVSLRSKSDAESFALGLKSFVNEAKLLARFDHPSLLKVHRFWEANGTAYMAMPVLRGRTVKEMRLDMTAPPDEAWLRRILMPLLGAIERLHSEGVYHRDIAPDNIQIEPDGSPVLLDFGAARRVLSDKSQALTAILKPAYAPIEQYGEAGAVKQGPWTDLYALGATLHYLLLGRPPPPATARAVHDDASSLTPDNLPGCSQSFLHTIDWMLCPRPTDRPQSVAELRDVLEGRARPPVRRPAESAPLHWERTSVLPPNAGGGRVDFDFDFDIGDGATQFMPQPAAAARVTAHARVDPDSSSAITAVYRPAVEIDIAMTEPLEMTAQRPPTPGAAAHAAAGASSRSSASRMALDAGVVLVGVLAVVAVVAGLWLWQQPGAGSAGSAVATPAPVAESMAVPTAAALAPTLVAPPVAAESAASAAVAIATPAAVSAAAALPTGDAPSVLMAPSEPVRTVEVPLKPRAERVLPAQRPNARPAQEAPRQRPQPAVPPVLAPALTPALTPSATSSAETTVAAGPAPSCGSREGVRYHICMERECARGEFAGHPTCGRWKQEARRE